MSIPGYHLIGDGGRVLDGPDVTVRALRRDPVMAIVWEVRLNGLVQPWRVAAETAAEAEQTARMRVLQTSGVFRYGRRGPVA